MESSSLNAPPSDLIGRPEVYPNRSLKRIGTWFIILLLATIFLGASVPKLGELGLFDSGFTRWGYPTWFAKGIGMIEATAAIFLIIPSTALYSAIVLGVVMIGAIITHLLFGEAVYALIPFTMLLLLTFVAWVRRPERVHTMIRRRDVGIE